MCLLANLELIGAALTTKGHRNTAKAIKNCKSLIALNLAQNDFGSHLGDLLSTKSPLIELNLSGNNLNDATLIQIASYIQNNPLATLDISRNCFGAQGVTHILQSANMIRKLVLDHNNLQQRDQIVNRQMNDAWSQLLPRSSLKHLSLVDCRIGPTTWKALSSGLARSKAMEVLSLRLNDFCDLQIPVCLQKLDLSKCNMSNCHLQSLTA